MLSDRTQPKTAFVFAGGGSFGAVQVGMLHSLVCHGLSADVVVGSSVGAMNFAYYAGTPTAEGVEARARVWRGLTTPGRFSNQVARLAQVRATAGFSCWVGRPVSARPRASALPEPARCKDPGAHRCNRSSVG